MAVEEEKTLDESLDESLRATLKDITERGDAPVEEAAPVAAAEIATEPAAEPAKDERARDASGKFIKAEDKPESAAPAEKPDKAQTLVASEQVAAEPPIVTTTGQTIDINRPPSSWKPAAKAAWTSLPEPIRAEVHRRESDFLNGVKGIKENADFGQSVKGIVEPYRMLIEAEGGTPERAIADTMRTAALFRVGTPQQKLEAIFAIDRQFNAGLNQHFQNAVAAEVAKQTGQPAPQAQAQQQVFQDPRVDQLLANMQKEERSRSQREEQASNSATEKFLAATDDKGQPLYPFVSNVLDDMSARVANLRRQNPALGHEEALKQAYEAAVWANPETRKVLLDHQQAQAQQPEANLRKVEQAKRANAGNLPKRGALPATAPVAKWGTPEADEEIRATYRQLTS